MVRLLHTADIHLGAKFLGLGDKGAAQREQIRASFKKLISQAIVENVDICKSSRKMKAGQSLYA